MLLPLLIVTALFAIGALFAVMNIDLDAFVGEELTDLGEDAITVESVKIFTQITLFITLLLSPLFATLISTVVYLIISKIIGSEVSFKQLFSMNIFIVTLGAISLLFNVVIAVILGMDPLLTFTGLGIYFDVTDPLYSFASVIEVFSIWSLILTAIGLQRVAEFKPATAWIITLVFTFGSALINLLMS